MVFVFTLRNAMQFFDILPLDSIYYVPPHGKISEAKPGAGMLMHILLWTPQIIWALLAALALYLIVTKKRTSKRRLLPVLPYVMIILVLAFTWQLFDVRLGPVLRTRDDNTQYFTTQIDNRIWFEDTAFPSLCSLPLLILVHLLALAVRTNKSPE